MPAGRPLKFDSVEELQKAIDVFFADCDSKEEPYTITGLALALDTSRRVLCEYEERDQFSNAIKRAKLRVENYCEKRLHTASSPTGPIFALKNFDWSDKVQNEHTGKDGGAIRHEHLKVSDDDQAILDAWRKGQ